MKKIIKNKVIDAYLFLSVHSAFYKHHKRVCRGAHYKKIALTADEKREYRDYWKRISPTVSIKTVEIAKSLSGVFDKHIVPEEFYALYVEPYLNDNKNLTFYENKIIYSKWFDEGIFPKVFFYKFSNNYYTGKFKIINDIEKFIDDHLTERSFPIVIKPNQGTFGGKDVNFVNNKAATKAMIKKYPNLIVEQKLAQSDQLNLFHKGSINSVRVSLYRDDAGVIRVLNTNLRMGKNGSLDNEGSGGIACHIQPNGVLNDYAIDKYANKYTQHPNSNFVFKNQVLPRYNALLDLSQHIASEVIGARIVGLDMVLDASQTWRCIELSLFGLTIKPAQYSGVPFLGKFTDEIVNNLIRRHN